MSKDSQVMYDLLLKPLRFDPVLTESVIFGLKWTLGSMFADPFPVRDAVVAVREVVDNVLTHAAWGESPAPSLYVRYRVHKDRPQLCVSTTNVVKDLEEATKAVEFVRGHLGSKSPAALRRELTTHLIESASIRTNGGIGLLQVASSPRCRLDVRLEGRIFHARVDVDVPELRSARLVDHQRTGS